MGKRDREGARSAEQISAVKMKSKRPCKHGGSAPAPDLALGASGDTWQTVEAGEDFHTGLDEDGFMGLEVLEAPKLFSSSKQPAPAAATAAAVAEPAKACQSAANAPAKVADAAVPAADDGKQKQQKRRKSDAAAAATLSAADAPAQAAAAAMPDDSEAAAAAAPAPSKSAAASGSGIDDEVAAALRAETAAKEKRRQEVCPALLQGWSAATRNSACMLTRMRQHARLMPIFRDATADSAARPCTEGVHT